MPKYLLEARYNAEGARGMKREGASARRREAEKLAESVGGKIESFYFAIGEVDVYVIFDAPDETTALALSLAANQTGVITGHLIPLIAPEAMDAAAKLAPPFRGAGQ